VVSDSELTKLPVNLKLNGWVDEGPLDLSVGRRDSALRSRHSAAHSKPEVLSIGSRLRSSKSQTLTSASLAKLVKRFGATLTSTTTALTSGTSSVVASCGGGGGRHSAGRDSHDAPPSVESSSRPRSVTAAQTSIFNPLLIPGNLLTSSDRPATATTFCSPPPPSRWRRDSFWANGGWLAGTTTTPTTSSSLVAERRDNRKRPQPAATSDSGVLGHRSQLIDALSTSTNRKLFSDHRKSSHRSSTRLRQDWKFSSSGHYDSSSRPSKQPPCPRESNGVSTVDCAATPPVKDSKPTSPKLARTDCDDHDDTTAAAQREAADVEKKNRSNANSSDVPASSPTPVRSNLTSLRCGSCGAQFESLYCLTVHLEETGHKPASDVAVLPMPSPATSPSSSDRKPPVTTAAVSASTPPMSAPQRLVRGQDVWLARGVEQTDRILRCIQCNAPARSLAELTLHMVHTKHYINIVGPTTSTTSNVVGGDSHQRAAVQPPRDKSADTVTLKAKNGLRIDNSKDHGLANAKIACRGRLGGSCASDADDDQTQQKSIFLPSAAVREHDANRNTETNTDVNDAQQGRLAVCSEKSNSWVVDGKLRTTERSAAFSVRNLIGCEMDGDRGASSATALHLPSSSPSDRTRDVTSSVGPEVTSSSDERPSPVTGARLPTVAESVFGHDVISA